MEKGTAMRVDIFQVQDRTLIVEDGKGIPRISGEGSEFLDGMVFQRQVDLSNIPTGLDRDAVLQSLQARGYFATRYSSGVNEIDIQE